LIPLLDAGQWVLLDRFVDSSLTYQGAGRGLGVEAVRDINRFATRDLMPERTLWLALDPAAGRARSNLRAEPTDRLEAEHEAFFEQIEHAYAQLADAEPQRIRRIDAAKPPEAVLS